MNTYTYHLGRGIEWETEWETAQSWRRGSTRNIQVTHTLRFPHHAQQSADLPHTLALLLARHLNVGQFNHTWLMAAAEVSAEAATDQEPLAVPVKLRGITRARVHEEAGKDFQP